ncbi:hypothetical protein AMTR_s00192p00040340 [Amborella trichopoda]|uniref:Aminotransferase-like plant mobile domain-containing protein n=1 Tax=Amborella trichopoda TaxID=13333 RepID=U5D8E3_AMBTC|nr:hypothetical protein AMTR_s00192p00040340 [Amborella trichopoda]
MPPNGNPPVVGSPLFAIRKWAELLTLGQRQALAWISLWEVFRIRPFSFYCALITELCLRYKPETGSIPLRCVERALTLEDVTRILGVRSEGLSILLKSSISYASDFKELLGIPFEKIKGRSESDIQLGKLRWDFTHVPRSAEGMTSGRAPHISISVASRPSHKEGVGCDIPELDDIDIDVVPPPVLLFDEEWREKEKERIREVHERAMIEDEPEVFHQELDLTINHWPLSDDERYSLRSFLTYLFGELCFMICLRVELIYRWFGQLDGWIIGASGLGSSGCGPTTPSSL